MMTKMSQQEFAKTIGVAPGSLSSVYSERIQPTSNYVVGIHKAFPNININWLMFGEGDMYVHPEADSSYSTLPSSESEDVVETPAGQTHTHVSPSQASLFDSPTSEPSDVISFQNMRKPSPQYSGSNHPRAKTVIEQIETAKNFDVHQRQVKEIRVFFDDGTYETFVPSK